LNRFAMRILRALNFYSLRALDKLHTKQTPQKTLQIKDYSQRAAVIVTTYSGRLFQYALPTISTLRASGLENEVFLVINGDQNSRYDQQLRHSFLRELLSEQNVNPVCLGSGRGMSELWNFGARAAGTEKLVFLGDDLTLHQSAAAQSIQAIEHSLEAHHLVILNNSFGHFGTSRTALSEVGWFDERFLGFGEEDGDYYWRVREEYGEKSIAWISHHGINNISSEIGFNDEIASNEANKYSIFNRAFLHHKYKFSESDSGRGFMAHPTRNLERDNRYLDEKFRDIFLDLTTERSFDRISSELKARKMG
jgi:hypothetical protein